MRNIRNLAISLCFMTLGSAAWAGTENFKLIHVSDLQKSIAADKTAVHIYDANTKETRTKDGLIPGAKPLSSVAHFDVTKELPADKNAKLVFYCANTQCMASHEAAERATKAGFTDVSVMADGIQGWKKAGQPVEKYAQK